MLFVAASAARGTRRHKKTTLNRISRLIRIKPFLRGNPCNPKQPRARPIVLTVNDASCSRGCCLQALSIMVGQACSRCVASVVIRPYPGGREHKYREQFAALLNYATLGFYWGAYEPERGKPHYDYTDQVVSWCRVRNIVCKGHPLAWDHPASSPKWLPNEPVEVERLSTTRVREIVARFKGRIGMWDVVNEPTDLTRFNV